MTTTRNFTKNTRWGHTNQTTSTFHCHPKTIKTTETYLFNPLPQDILTDSDILVYGLEYRDNFKVVIIDINPLCKPTLFVITQQIWAPYHNFSVYSCWYNDCSYACAHRCVPTNTCSRYQFIGSYYTVIETLTQRHIYFHKSVVACQ